MAGLVLADELSIADARLFDEPGLSVVDLEFEGEHAVIAKCPKSASDGSQGRYGSTDKYFVKFFRSDIGLRKLRHLSDQRSNLLSSTGDGGILSVWRRLLRRLSATSDSGGAVGRVASFCGTQRIDLIWDARSAA